jgi:L-aspartate oxidase
MSTPKEHPAGDALIAGAGLAGLFTALKLAGHGRQVTVLSGVARPGGATSTWAQGGIAAALGSDDSAALHVADTLTAGDGLVDEAAARALADDAPARIADLEALGVPFDHAPDGSFALGREGAHSRNRIAHVGGDGAGAAIMQALGRAAAAHPNIHIVPGWNAAELIVQGGTVTGILARGGVEPDAPALAVKADATVLATGGVGALYKVTTNPPGSRGHGLGLAARAGATVADVEFVQFHPTAIACDEDPAPLATEALRGEGATLHRADGTRLMEGVHPDLELAPRDIVARAIATQIASGGAVLLDCREAVGARFPDRFPAVYAAAQRAGIDPVTQMIPVAPAAHYHMGGVVTDLSGAASLEGLYACGEVARTGAHGANRLASNSLLESIVFGARIADAIAGAVSGATRPAIAPQGGDAPKGPDPHAAQITELRAAMALNVGVAREAASLEATLDMIRRFDTEARAEASGYRNMLAAAMLITAAAHRRHESRGGHARLDYPQTDETLTHTLPLTLDEAYTTGLASSPAQRTA